MALDIDKKKHNHEVEKAQKSKGLNTFLWVFAIILIAISAVGNIYFAEQISTPIRVVAIVVLLLAALGVLAVTNQGTKARGFLKDSRVELRKIVWPTRQEATQTTFIVIGATVLISLFLWGIDSIIVSVINFLTNLRF